MVLVGLQVSLEFCRSCCALNDSSVFFFFFSFLVCLQDHMLNNFKVFYFGPLGLLSNSRGLDFSNLNLSFIHYHINLIFIKRAWCAFFFFPYI